MVACGPNNEAICPLITDWIKANPILAIIIGISIFIMVIILMAPPKKKEDDKNEK